MAVKFNENTRVQVPALLHLSKLGYTYLSNVGNYDHKTNILIDVFKRSVRRLNPSMSAFDIDQLLSKIILMSSNDDLGREFYQLLTSISGIKLINFDDPSANEWHCTSEFTCEEKESGENFRPDITCFVNGLPLAFIEVKKPNNVDGILAERERINKRMRNKKFRTFLNLTQLMIFSNNQKYDNENRVPIQGAFYASISKTKAFFNVFREQNTNLYQECNPMALNEDVEKEILIHRNCVTIRNAPEYLSNQKPDTPTNSIITSMLSRKRFLFILRYGFAYVEKKVETESGEKITRLEKHVMRYQQLFASLAVRSKLDKGIKSGIIWHTQGSGKTALAFYSVRSLTDYFAKKNIAVKFYFIVDRIDLLEQAKGEFVARGLMVRTANSRDELMADFRSNSVVDNASGKPEIMVVNIQKFKEDHEKVDISSGYSTNLQRVFFIDEAHRGYNPIGSFLANLLDADKDAIKIALTGTPLIKDERASWRVFGDYIDKYYYDKSIADGYTLKLMREDIETSYKEKMTEILDKLAGSVEVHRRDIDRHKIIEHENYLNALLDYIIDDLRKFRIQMSDKTVAGMIVCETNPQARALTAIFNERFPDPNLPDALRAVLILHDEGDKLERKDSIEEYKKKETIDLLIVNKMLLTGFDAARLKKLYLGRKLDGHDLLQALTRVNRPYKDFKYGYVVDFADIKRNFEETNNDYLRELNRCNGDDESVVQDEMPIADVLIENKEEIIAEMKSIKNAMFLFNYENAEEFRLQLDEIDDKQQLYELRKTLETAKALTNQVRSFGDDELKEMFEKLSVGAIPILLSEVNNRITRINQLENLTHGEDVSGIINLTLSELDFKFVKRGEEELRIIVNDFIERYNRVVGEMQLNFDPKDEKFVNLADEFRRYFRKKGIEPHDVVEAKEHIGYMDEVMKKIREINRRNELLKKKYRDDERFVRIHKRIVEENEHRERPIISQHEAEIAEQLNELKSSIDERVYHNIRVMDNEEAFNKDVLALVSQKLVEMMIDATLEDRKFIRNQIAGEYILQYNQFNQPVAYIQ